MGLFQRFISHLEKTDSTLIPYAVDVGGKFEGNYHVDSDIDTFRIEVGQSEILAIFGYTHDHFSPDEQEEDTFHEVVEFAKDVISERTVAYYLFDDKGKLVSSILDAPDAIHSAPVGGKVRVKSFKGTFDKN